MQINVTCRKGQKAKETKKKLNMYTKHEVVKQIPVPADIPLIVLFTWIFIC